jgi:hypothetical protein
MWELGPTEKTPASILLLSLQGSCSVCTINKYIFPFPLAGIVDVFARVRLESIVISLELILCSLFMGKNIKDLIGPAQATDVLSPGSSA